MGALRIRKRHLKLARSNVALNPRLDELDTAKAMLEYYEYAISLKGLRIEPKTSPFPRWNKLTTTFRYSVRVGTNYPNLDTQGKALVLVHEWPHVLQWERYLVYGPRYLGARFGWAMEMQAYRESMRAMKVLQFSREHRERYASELPDKLFRSYWLMRAIRRKDLRRHTRELMRREL